MSRNIKILHLEPTDVCQAACPLCIRELSATFRKDLQHHLSMDAIMQVFDSTKIAALDKMYMCGNYGDPAAGKNTLHIYKTFREINPNITLGMNTNGALRAPSWWQELGGILNRTKDFVVFSIDGLEDTNHIYRKNVDWNKLVANAKAYIAAGGNAHWDMLVYQHNQHQIDQCKHLAKELGFKWFRSKVSMRKLVDNLNYPVGWARPILPQGTIHCNALEKESLYINTHGQVSVCSWLGSAQKDIISDIKQVSETWTTSNPHPTCKKMCSRQSDGTNFTNQWHEEIEL